jgi:hypothetical protein
MFDRRLEVETAMPSATGRKYFMTQASAKASFSNAPLSPDAHAARLRREMYSRGLILFAAFASFLLSVSLWFSGSELEGVFVGVWVPSIISLGAFLLPRRLDT